MLPSGWQTLRRVYFQRLVDLLGLKKCAGEEIYPFYFLTANLSGLTELWIASMGLFHASSPSPLCVYEFLTSGEPESGDWKWDVKEAVIS